MAENMTVVAEVWPLAADEHGIWLCSGDGPWRSLAIGADSDPHFEVELVIAERVGSLDVDFIHSTSWRCDGVRLIVTYMVCLACHGPVRARWGSALPVDSALLPAVGRPVLHGPTEAPVPRDVDVLHHGLQHLCYLREHNAGAAEVLTGYWADHLETFTPALAKMYT